MRKSLFLLLSILMLLSGAYAQTFQFQENFETLPLSVSSSGSANWSRSHVLHNNGSYSDSARIVSAGDTARLSSNSFSTIGYTTVLLRFAQICKLDFADAGYVEVSADNGATWIRLIGNQYLGSGQFGILGNKFNAISYATDWVPTNLNSIPQNNWWREEIFDISTLTANTAQVKVRFVAADGNNNGGSGNYGWLLDDIKVQVSNGELAPPVITLFSPYPSDTIIGTGPFPLSATITDASGIAEVGLVYTVNAVSDTIPMSLTGVNTYSCSIPSFVYNTTVCYYVYAIDSSLNANLSKNPSANCIDFVTKRDPSLPAPFDYDVAMDSINSPLPVVLANIPIPVQVQIKSVSDSTLTKATLAWSIDGVSQTGSVWTGNLGLDVVSAPINLGSATFTNGSHNLRVWSYLPNDSTDQNPANDTLSMSVFACNYLLNGTYTLGGPSADFSSFAELINHLNYCGISGSSTILVNPGMYNEQLYFTDSIFGLDSTHTLTIKGLTGNSSDVVILHDITASKPYTIGFYKTQWITIQDIKVVNESPMAGATVSIVGSKHITFNGCFIQTPFGNYGTNYAISLVDVVSMDIHFIDNEIDGGYYSVYMHGISSNFIQNNELVGNKINHYYRTGIYATRQNKIKINYNEFKRPLYVGSLNLTSIYLTYSNEYAVIGNESVLETEGSAYGIYISNANGTLLNHSKIYNNISIVKGNSTSISFRSIIIEYSSYLDFYHNTFVSYAGSSNSESVYVSNPTGTNVRFRNNIMANYGGSYAFEVTSSGTGSISQMNNNAYYTNGGTIMSWGGNNILKSGGITAIQSVTAKDTNSLIAEPMLYSLSNGRSFSPQLQSAGFPILDVPMDIDLNPRSASNPSIGASEFKVITADAGVLSILSPLAIDTQSNVMNMEVVVRNFGSDTIHAMPIAYRLNNGTPVSYAWSGTLLPAQLDTISIASITLPVLNYHLQVFTQLANDTNYYNDSLAVNYFALPLIDAQVISMEEPADGCDKGNNELVTITVKNMGVQAISSGLSVSYQIEGSSTIVSEVITASIAAGATHIHQFAQTANMAAALFDSLYIFKFSATHASDPNPYNDSLVATSLSLAQLASPIISDTTIFYGNSVNLTAVSAFIVRWFESDTSSTYIASGLNYSSPALFDSTTYWVQATAFVPPSSATIGAGSITPGTWDQTIYGGGMGSGKYQLLYKANELVAMGLIAGQIGSIAFQTSGSFTAPQTFDISMANVSNVTLSPNFVNISTTTVYSGTFTGVAGWNVHNLNAPFIWDGTSDILVQICATAISYFAAPMLSSTYTYNAAVLAGGMGVSCATTSGLASFNRPNTKFTTSGQLGCSSARVPVNVNVPPLQYDAKMHAVINPISGCGIAQSPVVVQVVNQGTDTIPAGFSLRYRINNGNYGTAQTISNPLAPADTLEYTFNTMANLAPGASGTKYAITAKLDFTLDQYSLNDTLTTDSINSMYTPSNPIVSGQTINYTNVASLSGTASDSLFYYADSTLMQYLGMGNPFVTTNLYDTTTLYVVSQKNIPESFYQIGNGTIVSGTNGPAPYGSTSFGARHQFLIRASELTAMGLIQGPISSLAFDVSQVKGNIMKQFTLKIGHTQYNDLNQIYFDSTLTTVFGSMDFMESYGWTTHQFSTPFYWDGVSNLIIETCFKGTSNLSYVGVKSTATNFVSTAQSQGAVTFSCSNHAIANTFSLRPNIKLLQEGFGTCQSAPLAVTVNVINHASVDAGLIAFTEPINSASSMVQSPVKLILKNYGLNNLTAATIYWTENGVAQNSLAWTGNLAHGAQDTLTLSASFDFKGGTTILKAWVDAANDNIVFNDSISITLDICMSGNYSIGLSSADYPSFNAAIADMIDCSICGPVTFNVDSGSYTERVIIPYISGSSSINTITFQSATLDSSDVNIQEITNSQTNYVVLLNAAQNVIIKHLTITALGNYMGNAVVLTNHARNIRITNNLINSTLTTGSNSVASAVSILSAHDVIVDNNLIINGYYALSASPESSAYNLLSKITFSNNIIEGFYKNGVRATYVDSLVVIGNKMVDLSTTTASYGIYGYYLRNGFNISNNYIKITASTSAYCLYLNAKGTATNRGLIANNMIISNVATNAQYGVYLTSSEYVDIAHNSINNIAQCTAASTRALYTSAGVSLRAINNSFFVNQGYVAYIQTPNALIQMDYNNYKNNSGNMFYWGTTNLVDLAALKTIDPTKNVHSISENPMYYAFDNLHSSALDFYNTALPFARVITDYDGESRSLTAPSIGADEFTVPAIDLGIVSLAYPSASACGYVANDSIVVNIYNFGQNNINFSSLPATIVVEVSGINPDTLTYVINSGQLNSNASMRVNITSLFDLSQNGVYVFDAIISISGDGNSVNDTMIQSRITSVKPISTFPHLIDFENGQNLSLLSSSGFESNLDINTFASNNSTYGMHFTGGTYYNWVDPANVTAAFNNVQHVAKAYTCEVNATNSIGLKMRFDLKQTASNTTGLLKNSWFRVLLTDVNGIHYLKNLQGDSVFRPTTFNTDPFTSHTFDLVNYVGQNFTISYEAALRYEYGGGYGYDGDNALVDNILFWEPTSVDVSVNKVLKVGNVGQIGLIAQVNVEVENYGVDTLVNIPLAYQINNGTIFRDTLYSTLLSGAKDTFVFSQSFNLVGGLMQICAFAEYPNDMISSNDTSCLAYKGLKNILPNYTDNFEGNDDWMSVGTYTQWQLGSPNKTHINAAHSGNTAWVTQLSGDYITSTIEYLYTPYFTILAYPDTVTLSFWHFMRTLSTSAFGTLEYSINGQAWSSIGYIGDPNTSNWYNVNHNGQHKWSMMNNTWIKSWIKLSPSVFNTGATVQFRFKFESTSSSVSEEGWAIDDFQLFFPPQQFDAGIVEIMQPTDTLAIGSNFTIKVKIRNFGTDTLNSIPVNYTLSGGIPVAETFVGTLLPDSTAEHTFQGTHTADPFSIGICANTSLSNDMQNVNDNMCKSLVITPAIYDAGVSSIVNPIGQTIFGQATPVVVYIKNYGTDTLSNIPIFYLLSGMITGQETYSGTINPFDSVQFQFSQTYFSPIGYYQIEAKTNLANDAYSANDSTKVFIFGTVGLGDNSESEFWADQNLPNPARNVASVAYNIPRSGTVKYSVINVLGEKLLSFERVEQAGKHHWNLPVDQLEAGVYYYTIIFENKAITHKMAIIK